jgi:DNA polymerase
MIPKPINPHELPAGTILNAGLGISTVLADLDFETYSPAGFMWNKITNKWEPLPGASVKGLSVIGAAKYAEHPETEVLSLAYNLKDGQGPKLWRPGDSPPTALFDHIKQGGLLEAWNCAFEYWIWTRVCIPKYGWPPLPLHQLRDAMAKARAHALPGSLDAIGNVLNLINKKDKTGKRLLNRLSIPRNPTKTDPRIRITIDHDDAIHDFNLLWVYNIQDITAEAEASSLIPDLSPAELGFWQCDQAINVRGVQIDQEAVNNCIAIIEQAHKKYNAELQNLTRGAVRAASEVQKLAKWMRLQGVQVNSLDADSIATLLNQPELPPIVRRALEIRSMLGSAAVKKLYAMKNQMTRNGRLHDLFVYHSARTGRAAGMGPQPQNLPNNGPEVFLCVMCCKHYSPLINDGFCPWCNICNDKPVEWNTQAVEDALTVINTANLECVEYYWNDAIATVSGCLRGLFIAAPGHDLICSDYSAIEAVVLAALAGEEWRLEVFRTHGQIYEMSASKITGIPFSEFENYKQKTEQHHPLRKLGKVAELASGYQGWIKGWQQFGADEFLNEEEIKKAVLAWRAASPAIVNMWGGQQRNWQKEYFGIEGAAVAAVLSPGNTYEYRGIKYLTYQNVLYCRLLSGRYLTYHKPQLEPGTRSEYALTFEGWNTNPKNGSIGWTRMQTYGGRLVENIVQATARDILAHAIVNLEKTGYRVVLHVHDEIVAEMPEGRGSLEDFERIMSTMPSWAANWPIRAKNGWRGKRYRK